MIMKRMKKFLAFALSVVMCLGMAVTASAEGEKAGLINMSNATPNTAYVAYRLFDANPAPTTGESTTEQVAYTTGKAQAEWFENQTENPFTFTQVAGTETYTVAVSQGKSNDDVTEFLNGLYTKEGEDYSFADGFLNIVMGKIEATADANGKVAFDDVPYGYYLITSGLGATVTVSSTNPTATVIDKNVSKPTFPEDGGKVILNADGTSTIKNTVNYGETVNFKVSIQSSNYDGAKLVTQYVIKDTLDAGMSYVAAEGTIVAVKVGDQTLTKVAADPGKNQYTINTAPTGVTAGKSGFEITIPWAAGQTDEDGNVLASTVENYYTQGAMIEVTYAAKVNVDAATGTPLKNSATFHYYTNNQTTPENPDEPSKETETVTYSFDLVKTNKQNAVLDGAKFSLYDSQSGGTAIQFVEVKEDDTVVAYRRATAEEIANSSVVKTTTIEAGNITVKGLAGSTATKEENGEQVAVPVSYWLEETEAPAGYNMITDRKEVAISNRNLNASVENGIYQNGGIEVENVAGSLLPSTGGIGTTIFYLVGGLLAAGAGILLITKKRMKKEQ